LTSKISQVISVDNLKGTQFLENHLSNKTWNKTLHIRAITHFL